LTGPLPPGWWLEKGLHEYDDDSGGDCCSAACFVRDAPARPVAGGLTRGWHPVLVFESDWVLRYTIDENPNVTFLSSL